MVFPINIASTKLFYQFSVQPTNTAIPNFYGIFEVNATRLINKKSSDTSIGAVVDIVPSGVVIAVYESTKNSNSNTWSTDFKNNLLVSTSDPNVSLIQDTNRWVDNFQAYNLIYNWSYQGQPVQDTLPFDNVYYPQDSITVGKDTEHFTPNGILFVSLKQNTFYRVFAVNDDTASNYVDAYTTANPRFDCNSTVIINGPYGPPGGSKTITIPGGGGNTITIPQLPFDSSKLKFPFETSNPLPPYSQTDPPLDPPPPILVSTPPVLVSNICFPAGTPIQTDQGQISIEKINPNIHTIHNKKIVDITKTISPIRYLVCFEKNSLLYNYPKENTIVSRNHKILYNGKMIEAYKFIGIFKHVKKINYKGEILYNVLMEEYETIIVNNLICETLHPNNPIAKIYKFYKTKNQQQKKKKLITNVS